MYFDYLILGGGIAGLSLARSLLEYGQKVMLLDTRGVGFGASGAPVSLGNPATGPKAKLIWRAETCYKRLTRQLELASISGDKPVYQISGILRPALDKKLARKMKKQFDETRWPPRWAHWLSESEVSNLNSDLTCVDGGIWLPIGLTINTMDYLSQLCDHLIENGLYYENSPSYRLSYDTQKWTLKSGNNEISQANEVIDCTGYETTRSDDWDFIPIEAVKGQLAIFSLKRPISGRYAIAGGGYIARLSNRRILVGSTYEHDFKTTQSTEEGIKQLKNKLLRLLPNLEDKIEFSDTWAGVRVSAKDHMPVLGKHPEIPGLYIFTGLGSKGMLYSAHLAECLSEYIINDKSLPEEVDLNRFLQ